MRKGVGDPDSQTSRTGIPFADHRVKRFDLNFAIRNMTNGLLVLDCIQSESDGVRSALGSRGDLIGPPGCVVRGHPRGDFRDKLT